MKKTVVTVLLGLLLCTVTACSKNQVVQKDESNREAPSTQELFEDESVGRLDVETEEEDIQTEDIPTIEVQSVINEQGMTLAERIQTPKGYTRTKEETGSLAEFLREYPLKEAGSEVLLYDGSPKGNQGAHVAVLELPIEAYDLQQCADSVMRVYAEYFWHTGQYDRIAFHFTNGFLAEYTKWRDGYRIEVNGNDVTWSKSAAYDDSYECFVKYLKIVFSYAGTLSLETEVEQITPDEIAVGDVFIHGGSPGHVVMIVDVCEDLEGNKAFLLAQGYMPAQEFHVLKNEQHEEDPWYYTDELEYPFRTPEYTFDEGALKRFMY